MQSKFIGKKVIVRCEGAGVFYGVLEDVSGQVARISKARQLWYWDGAASLMELSISGVKKPRDCNFTVTVEEVEVGRVIEVLPCTEEAIKSIERVAEWKA